MISKNPKIDLYIEKSEPFAKEILYEIRKRIHDFYPEIEETIKWGFPNFTLNGQIVCFMSAFKTHCSFGFWLASLMKFEKVNNDSMGNFGKIKSIDDLPEAPYFNSLLEEAIKLTLSGVKLSKNPKKETKIIENKDFIDSLLKNVKAYEIYINFSNSHKKEYNEWINEAKKEETKNSRILKSIEQILEGKSRNWKYEKSKNQ